jgi:DNA (cytosine-5)-methyltransferase 1
MLESAEDALTHRRSQRIYNHVAPILSATNLKRMRHVPQGGNWRNIPFKLLPAGMQRALETDHTKRYGRLSKRGRCCTILTKCDPHWGSYIHPSDDRAISVREAARLQGFPDRFQFCGPRMHQFVQVGNAVPPLLARAIARAVRRHLRENE